jgi:hypothetical protein
MRPSLPLSLILSFSATMLAGAPPATAVASAASGPIPAAAFFANPRFNDAKLSPSGRYLAVRMGRPGMRDGLTVVKLADLSATPVAQFGNVDIGDYQWVNDERLVYDTRDSRSAPGDAKEAPGLFAVNRDGGGFLQLVDRGYDQEETTGTHMSRKLLPWNTYLLGQEGTQDSEYVYVVQTERKAGDVKELTLLRLNTLTGRAQGVPRPPNMLDVRLDAKGEPRLATSYDRDRVIQHYRETGADTWRKLADFSAYGAAPGAFQPLGLGADGTLYVVARAGGDKSKVYSYDLVKGELGKQPLIDLGDYDFSGRLVYGGGKLLGVRLLTDARSTHWWSKDLQAVQDKVDQLLPGTVNQIAMPQRPETPWLLLTSWSDRQPRVYVLYNRETQTLTKIGEAYPDIPAARMARQQLLHYKARDGLSIPAWLTLPPGGKQNGLPMVVLVHGGPFMRGGEWGWDADAQFLASRGYAVLEPEFRGSTGFGMRGWLQAMGPGHAGRPGRRRARHGGAGRGRRQAHLHRRRQLWRLCGADGRGQGRRPVPVRGGLGRRDRHQTDVQRQLEHGFRPDTGLSPVRHAAAGRRPECRRGTVAGHVATGAGRAHQAPAAAGLRQLRPARAAGARHPLLRGRQGRQSRRGMGGVRRRRPRLVTARQPRRLLDPRRALPRQTHRRGKIVMPRP